MTSSLLKTAISYLATAIMASFLTTVFMNSRLPQTNHCERTRLRRGENLLWKEKKNETSKKVKMEKVFLKSAVKIGAVCLDGSPPGYHFRKGFGNGAKKWILFFEGGAWCYDEQACYQRSHGIYGSSRFYTSFSEGGLYSNDPKTNPDFYNWNMVFIRYCDGSSFTGMREKPVYFKNKPVYFRGKAILDVVIQDLLDRGVRIASDVLLTGSSAGSLAVLIHADYIKAKLNSHTKIRAIADSGYFIDLQTQHGTNKIREMFNRMLITHNSTSGLHKRCIKRIAMSEHWKCLFPQYFFDFIETPFFILQSAYDVWQIVNNLDVVCTIPSYKDMLLFRSLKRLRTSGSIRENPVMTSSRDTPRGSSRASRGSSHAQKINSISVKNAHWRTNVPSRTYSSGPRVYNPVSRVPRVNSRGNVQSLVSNNQYPALRNTFEGVHVLTSQNAPVWRSPRWKNNLGRQVSDWNNPTIVSNTRSGGPGNEVTPRTSLLYARPFNAPVTSQDLRQQNFGNTQKFPLYNSQQSVSSLDPSSVHLARTSNPENVGFFRQKKEPRTYSVIHANAAHFRQKREARSAQRVLPKSRTTSANVAQKREPKKAEHVRPKSDNDVKKTKKSYRWHWQLLYSIPTACTRDETEKILSLRKLTLNALKPVLTKPNTGLFLSPCFEHTQATYTSIWKTNKIKGKSIRAAISEWYFEKPGNHIHIGREFDFGSCTM